MYVGIILWDHLADYYHNNNSFYVGILIINDHDNDHSQPHGSYIIMSQQT